ncbi:MAG TPA: hypothetical protein VG406_16335 [Isosphaeraceae bacterium]|jgi:hypothetical protein|nr:hypothetical protein [Isosphaeraceae bacterium]
MNIARDSSYPRYLEREARAEGKASEARRLLRLIGDNRFGTPDEETARAIDDIDRLEQMFVRLLNVTGWAELMATD